MKTHNCFPRPGLFFLLPSVIVLGSLLLSISLHAQTISSAAKGDNAVWSSSAIIAGSSAFIDASAWASSGTDFCVIVGDAIAAAPSSGAVIDARGINTNNSSMSCAASPWAGIAFSSSPPITILLPSGTIIISAVWILPNKTQIIGEGRLNTLIQPSTGYSGDLIDMGSSSCPSGGCSGISVQRIHFGFPSNTYSGTNTNNGVVNDNAQANSYVDDVSFANLGGASLVVSAANSGPYSNINYGTNQSVESCTVNSVTTVCPACVILQASTRGVHGLTCSGDTSTANKKSPNAAAVQVQAGSNAVADVHIEAFWDGIQVGGTASVGGVSISNISAANNGSGGGFVTNAVHLCGSHSSNATLFGVCETGFSGAVSDVSVLGVSNCNGVDAPTVEDDVTGTTIAPTANTNSSATEACNYVGTTSPTGSSDGPGGAYVATYDLGESATGGGYTRLNTTIAAYTPQSGGSLFGNTLMPVWGVDDLAPVNNANTPVCQPGSLFSNTSGSPHSLYVCVGGTGSGSGWQNVTTN